MSHAYARYTMDADVPRELMYQLITDYLAYPEIVSEIVEAKVVGRGDGYTDVAYVAKILWRRFDYTIRMRPTPTDGMTWSHVASKLLKENEGGWELEDIDDGRGTRITYFISVKSKAFIPRTFTNAVMRLTLPGMVKGWIRHAKRLMNEQAAAAA